MSDNISVVDTHCHIHDDSFYTKEDITLVEMIEDALKAGVERMVCVGTDVESSTKAIKVAGEHDCLYASIALHPHEAADMSEQDIREGVAKLEEIASRAPEKLVAIGECGLDYFYHADEEVRTRQELLLRLQLDIAVTYDLPVIFHVRNAFDDFFSIMKDYPSIRGVLHSFTDSKEHMVRATEMGLYIGLNGIMTFTREEVQLDMAKAVPLDKLLLETDAPFLTPKPFRGKICKPEHIMLTAAFLSDLRGEAMSQLATATTDNAKQLFTIK